MLSDDDKRFCIYYITNKLISNGLISLSNKMFSDNLKYIVNNQPNNIQTRIHNSRVGEIPINPLQSLEELQFCMNRIDELIKGINPNNMRIAYTWLGGDVIDLEQLKEQIIKDCRYLIRDTKIEWILKK